MLHKKLIKLAHSSLLFALVMSMQVQGKGVYQTSKEFITQAFNGDLPAPSMLWLTANDQQQIADLLQQKFNRMRIRYWRHNGETVWVLEHLGKEKSITFAVHIKKQKIRELKVLEYRESRGDEVSHAFFANQFVSASLTKQQTLTQHIDGITGATLSVNAAKNVARLALWLNNKVQSTPES